MAGSEGEVAGGEVRGGEGCSIEQAGGKEEEDGEGSLGKSEVRYA